MTYSDLIIYVVLFQTDNQGSNFCAGYQLPTKILLLITFTFENLLKMGPTCTNLHAKFSFTIKSYLRFWKALLLYHLENGNMLNKITYFQCHALPTFNDHRDEIPKGKTRRGSSRSTPFQKLQNCNKKNSKNIFFKATNFLALVSFYFSTQQL